MEERTEWREKLVVRQSFVKGRIGPESKLGRGDEPSCSPDEEGVKVVSLSGRNAPNPLSPEAVIKASIRQSPHCGLSNASRVNTSSEEWVVLVSVKNWSGRQ